MTRLAELTEASAERHLGAICFKIGPPSLVGVEAEWFVHDARCPGGPVDPARVASALAALPGSADGPVFPAGSRLTHEPGGQVELSSPPAADPAACAAGLSADQAVLRAALAAEGLRLTGTGTDPMDRERRMLARHPRYRAMERYFGRGGPWGRIMMTGTASVQVCVDAGTERTFTERWGLTHLLGPVLVAAFANSPLLEGRPTGWKSTRQLVWSRMDPSRTLAPPPAADPREAWTRYVLDAAVLCVRREDGLPWDAPSGLTFRSWLRGGGERPATMADLDYHRTTLFPPVRPRGHLELRMIDAQPGEGWRVPLALVTALMDDPVAAEEAAAALERLGHAGSRAPRSGLWRRAAALGMADPDLRRAALACFAAAERSLARRDGRLRPALVEFAERYPARGRCPADDQLAALRTGTGPALQEDAPC
ncbi:ergothioneine biosynthesis glutamate--cysteine ligase EgtA [Streptomyces sp. TLI_171]|uniref:ergothioneine biosynthesis glutamate--cysteine ligase EgtA n=1 Tax=Streptomyces sp. TLI_171 TaxID=1938859 RepID=UPI000C690863|nr:ergothioneine biosynthesis glutamate--cysteine ligase EgtA [Streptomyces sp. TLI_171]RKE22605.1 glutamate--cysteine ligase [Streptomyces sp. TLI_171]